MQNENSPEKTTPAWAIYYIGHQVSKEHSTRDAAVVEAFEMKIVATAGGRTWLAPGYTIQEIRHA